ncbi:hypothetical protein DdX_16366 [Ditylenchus destructor]|uniref:Uncharacterized protein n=1 Tax=Ditylenchus destructor TaxID=166010 RepID=A0AAD4R006_9BILA|nr:hypothetical protein DdX_16366 [Ditylenchus destructor]
MSLSKPNVPLDPLLETLSFYNRSTLYLFSRTSRFLNQLIQQNFPSKPYAIWKDKELTVRLNANKQLRFEILGFHSDANWYDIESRVWRYANGLSFHQKELQKIVYPLETMRRYLPLFVRIASVTINVDYYTFSRKDIQDLESLAHVWDGQKMRIEFHQNVKDDSVLNTILSSPKFIRCRQLTVTNLPGVPLHSQNYSSLYNLQFLHLDIRACTGQHVAFILNFIRNKVHHPESETILTVKVGEYTCLGHMPPIQDLDFDLVDQICKDFTTSVTPNKFCLLLKHCYRTEYVGSTDSHWEEYRDCYKISLPLCEYRMENSRTNEVLQFVKTKFGHENECLKKLGLANVDPGYHVFERFSF